MRHTALPLALAALLLIPHAHAEARVQDRTLTARDGDTTLWTRTFPATLGPISDPVTDADLTWVGIGPELYAFGPTGDVRTRLDLPAPVIALDTSSGTLSVTVQRGTTTETYTVADGAVRERVVLPPDPDVTGWLARAAQDTPQPDPRAPTRLADLQRRADADPTNPFLHVDVARAADAAGQDSVTAAAATRAISATVPFYASVQLAQRLDALGLPFAADTALRHAREDYAARGFDPAVPVNADALRAYGNPLGYLRTLLAQNRLQRADAWLRYLRDTTPRFEGYVGVYTHYANLLDAQDRAGEANEWRTFTRELARGSLYNLGPDAPLAVRDAARTLAGALLIAIIAAYLTLGARGWPTQTRDTRTLGGRWRSWALHPLSRARRTLISYTGFGEKLVMNALLIGLVFALGTWTWASRTYVRADAAPLNFGTYGGAYFYDGLDRLNLDPSSREVHLLRGLAAQLDGEVSTAREQYSAALPNACAQNNLGVLSQGVGDAPGARSAYRDALTSNPDLSAPAYNLGLNPAGYEAAFQRTYRPDTPRLCYPSLRDTYAAVDGALGGELTQVFSNPWTYLTRLPTGLPRVLQWAWAALLLLVTFVSLLWLLLPRLPLAPGADRPALFRVLAVLLPGTAFLDGAWGMVLLLTWATTVVGLLVQGGWVHLPYLLDLTTPAARAALTATLLLTYSLNTLLVVGDELRLARRRRRAVRTP
ncbi:hypothetical protein [Deinococcus maricopensis]|uniref:Tetratricopeptide TPR_2 n=1 Tax=Deinococcus maricopensis (strain DSM 21211 / LMG 22137 / NRRL B-23946 / LB-34) TaxID=709986 RepID=E8U6L0_DEIML|nr:hypothetical protein [Deinococcus maricopensis]ADV66699.1 tetratricopeptide TPR_2 [Deinococcus maricopensis DSM 21211]